MIVMTNTKDIVYLLMSCNQSSNFVTYLNACASNMYGKRGTFHIINFEASSMEATVDHLEIDSINL
jgi:hypothetical protein